MTADEIIIELNEWRANLLNEIRDEPGITDDLNGPVQNLPPLEGDDLAMIKSEIERKLADGWPANILKRYMRWAEEVCPFWTEELAIKRMKELRDRALLTGARK